LGGPTSRPEGAAAFFEPEFRRARVWGIGYAVLESHNQLKYYKITVLWKIATCGKVAEKGA
jgi:hypothetical protein